MDNPQDQNQPAGIKKLRTYAHDIARLIHDNKLSKQDLAKIDKKTLEDAKNIDINDDFVVLDIAKKLQNFKAAAVNPLDDFAATLSQIKGDTTKGEIDMFDTDTIEVPRAIPQVEKKFHYEPLKKTEAPRIQPKIQAIRVPAAPSTPQTKPQPAPHIVQKVPVAPKAPEVHLPDPYVVAKQETPLPPKPKQPEPLKIVKEVVKEIKEVPYINLNKELSPQEKLQEEGSKVKQTIESMKADALSIQSKKLSLAASIQAALSKNQPLKVQEQQIEKEEGELRSLVSSASTAEEKHELEKKRWSLEDERQRIERERWDIDQSILEIEKQMVQLKAEESDVEKKERIAEKQLHKIEGQEKSLKAQADKKELLVKFEEVKSQRLSLESRWKEIVDKLTTLHKKESNIEDKKVTIVKEIISIESEEKAAHNPQKVHEIESKRWEKDEELRLLEKEEWNLEEQQSLLKKSSEDIESQSQEILHMEKTIKERIAELDALIKAV